MLKGKGTVVFLLPENEKEYFVLISIVGIQKVHVQVFPCAQAREEGVYRHDHR